MQNLYHCSNGPRLEIQYYLARSLLLDRHPADPAFRLAAAQQAAGEDADKRPRTAFAVTSRLEEEVILRSVVVINIMFTVGAIIFSIWLQQLTPMAIRASAFKTFQEKVTDEERDHILNSAAQVVFWSVRPLVVTSMIWIVIGCGVMIRKTPLDTQSK